MIAIKEFLKDNVLLFDGGMGTYYVTKSKRREESCELATLFETEVIKGIHREYLEAGCKAIKTNTFGINRINLKGDETLAKRAISTAYAIAKEEASKYDAYVFADLGPISNLSNDKDPFEEYKFVVDAFLELGASNFLFETNSNLEALSDIATYIKGKNQESYIITSFAIQPDGYTRDGLFLEEILGELGEDANIDALGLNCVCGARHMLELVKGVEFDKKPLSLMPNAGYPIVLNNRTFYDGDPKYFAEAVSEMTSVGAKIIGGCCGTTPNHLSLVKEALSDGGKILYAPRKREEKTVNVVDLESQFWNKLINGEKVVAVELDSPMDASIDKFMKGATELKEAGTDIITIADCPIARARMDSSILACKIKRELSIDALPHMTCRDRNLNATKALMLGLYAEGIRNLLLVTGDPIPTAEKDEVKSVYQFNSRKLASFARSLGNNVLPSEFHLFGALNVNAINFDIQLKIAKEKEEKGMVGFLTQPILSPEAFENLKRARKELKGFILGGIIPIVSEKNARYMDSEINGINVDSKLFEMFAGKSREECEAVSKEISLEIINRISEYVDGYYLMTPFGRTGLISEIIKEIR